MKKFILVGLPLVLIACLAMVVSTQDCAEANGEAKTEVKAEEHGYIGAAKCKVCHKKEKKGNQYGKWLESDHAQAYTTLLSDESKAICKEMGITEAPEKAAECLKCHITGHGAKAELLGKKYTIEEGVSCEACHGAAKDWKKPHAKDPATAKTLGLMDPTDEKMCRACHNPESPTYKEFVYKDKLAMIAHPNPMKEK